jgi:RHS repeat-associated protein
MTERDSETGLDHAWWRKHENLSGRWTSPDPYNRSMATADPQSFNRYSYVGNDPVNFIDPTGLVIIRTFISCGYALYDYWDGESWQTDIGLFCFLVTEISPTPAPEPGPGGVTPTQTKEECDPHFFKDTDTFKIGDKTFTGADLNVAARTVYAESESGFKASAQNGVGDDSWAERNAIASVMYNMLSDRHPTFNAVANNGRYQAVTSPSHNQKFKNSDIASGAYKNLKERDANGGGGDCNDLRASVDAIRRMVNNKGPYYDFDRFRGGRTPVGNSTVIGGSRFGYAGKTDTGRGPW